MSKSFGPHQLTQESMLEDADSRLRWKLLDMILRGERKLTVDHVRTLSAHFGVPADLFLS